MSNTIHVEEAAVIDATPEAVYNVISDYHVGHPAILPKPTFQSLTVLKGGRGAGSEVEVRMKAFGVQTIYHLTAVEPEPGRVLVESDEKAGVSTAFIFEPVENGQKCRLTISTDMRLAGGLRGFIEKRMNPPFMHRLYRQELANINAYLQK